MNRTLTVSVSVLVHLGYGLVGVICTYLIAALGSLDAETVASVGPWTVALAVALLKAAEHWALSRGRTPPSPPSPLPGEA